MSSTNAHGSYDDRHNDDVAHEHSDINVRAIVGSAAVIAFVCVVTAVLMYGMFWFLEGQAQKRDPRMSRLAMPATDMPPTTNTTPSFGSAPDPKLLTNEPEYLRGYRTREQGLLQDYGWVDQAAGLARLPIDRAKALIVERGLPVRPDAVSDAGLGTNRPALGESSSGRVITEPPAAESPTTTPAQPADPQKPAESKPTESGHK
jgi:hypothetical protein